MAEPVCPKCSGSSWVISERDGVSGAERCDCVLRESARHAEANAKIPPLYRNASVENFLLPDDNPMAKRDMGAVVVLLKSYAREFPNTGKPGLLLIGDPGTGKTHLAVAVLRMLIERGFEGIFFDYQNLLDRIRAGYDPSSGSSDKEAYRVALDAGLLLLDDLGAHRVSDWVEDTVTSVVTYRCNHRKPTIVTTNLADSGTEDARLGGDARLPGRTGYQATATTLEERIGKRARSRLFEMCRVIRMPLVEDYRLRRKR